MPRRFFRRRRPVRRRRRRVRRTRRGRGSFGSIARVVRRVLMHRAETKILPVLITNTTLLGPQTTYVFNPAFQVSQGVGSGSRVGRKISNAVFFLNLRATIIGENTLTTNVADEAVLRMLVLRSRAVKTAGVAANVFQTNPAGMTLADIFYAVADFSTFSQVDKNRWTVLRDVLIKSKRVNDNDNAGIAGYRRFAIPLGKNLVYRDDGAANSFLTGSETYVLFVAGWRQGTGPDLTMHLSTQGTIRWKDM